MGINIGVNFTIMRIVFGRQANGIQDLGLYLAYFFTFRGSFLWVRGEKLRRGKGIKYFNNQQTAASFFSIDKFVHKFLEKDA